MASPGPTSATTDTPVPIDVPPESWPFPGEGPLGSDEPSAPVDVPAEAPSPGIGPDVPPGDPAGPDLRVRAAMDGLQPGEALASYADRAMDEAVEAGLTYTELRAVLQGASVAELIPPYPGEGLAAYADRATSELLTRYLAQNAIDPL